MLLVSIHDVSPATALPVRQLWELCLDRGVVPALLVVPNWHGEWPLESYPEMVRWILDRQEEGAEIVLHGERHDEAGLRRTLKDHVRALGRTDREGEFLTLNRNAARERLMRGLERLQGLGLRPSGFVPPAWLARDSTHEVVAALGLSFSEDDHSVWLHPSEQRIPSPVLRWSTRSPLRAWGSVAVAATRGRLQLGAPVARIALHPPDLDHSATRHSVDHALAHWLARHAPGRYADLPAQLAA